MKIRILFFVFLLSSFSLFSQELYKVNYLEFQNQNGVRLKNPFTGGLITPIFNQIDLNLDGVLDMVVLDRNGFSWRASTYINENNNYVYRPKYEKSFVSYTDKFLLKDFNCDGIPDMVLLKNSSPASIYKGVLKSSDTSYSFTFIKEIAAFDTNYINGNPIIQKYVLPYNVNSIPQIVDIDQDGDLDFMTNRDFLSAELNVITVFKNLQKEKQLSCDSFNFSKMDDWGSFKAYIDTNLNNPITIRPRHSEYQYLWHLDANNDKKIDIVITDEMFNNAPLGLNVGIGNKDTIRMFDTFFPKQTQSIDFFGSIGYWMDVDQDNRKDILVGFITEREKTDPLDTGKRLNDDVDVCYFYKNYKKSGPIAPGVFDSFVRKSFFLSPDNIDVGTASFPLFYDYDNDNKMDILISNNYRITRNDRIASITLYKNIGTLDSPIFKWITDDYLNFRQRKVLNLKMSKGDLNADSVQDLIFIFDIKGAQDKRIAWYINPKDATTQYNAKDWTEITDNNTVENWSSLRGASPLLMDLNKDNLLDLIIGSDYRLSYVLNSGTKNVPLFKIAQSKFNYYSWDYNIQNQTPFLSQDNKLLISCYDAYDSELNKVMELTTVLSSDSSAKVIDSNVFGYFSEHQIHFTIADINNDTFPDYLMGNSLGGVKLFTTNKNLGESFSRPNPKPIDSSSLIESKKVVNFLIFPNPANHFINIKASDHLPFGVSVYNLKGQLILSKNDCRSEVQLDVQNFAEGTYYLQLEVMDQTQKQSFPFIIRK